MRVFETDLCAKITNQNYKVFRFTVSSIGFMIRVLDQYDEMRDSLQASLLNSYRISIIAPNPNYEPNGVNQRRFHHWHADLHDPEAIERLLNLAANHVNSGYYYA